MQQIKVRLVAIKSAYFFTVSLYPLQFSRTLPLNGKVVFNVLIKIYNFITILVAVSNKVFHAINFKFSVFHQTITGLKQFSNWLKTLRKIILSLECLRNTKLKQSSYYYKRYSTNENGLKGSVLLDMLVELRVQYIVEKYFRNHSRPVGQ